MDLDDPKSVAAAALACLDLTELGDAATEEATLKLVGRSTTDYGATAAVCIWPRFVATARARLGQGAPVRIATVVNFPSGDLPVDAVVAETIRAIADGADEIDLVIPYRAFIQGDEQAVRAMIRSVRAATKAPARLKTILETGELKDPELIARASEIALDEGADFIKTSTGKVSVNATPEAARIMLEAIRSAGGKAGFKPAGGIRTVADARAYFALCDEIMGRGWVSPETFRFGASGLLGDILATLEDRASGAQGEGY
ncbi:MAG: deoxyribose-phosphate aldolase [Hoeflea sp.]|uniref:deoxyribose-phosphate aldolase n=1 Tax=Hoeflea sp. TaxID=1940281 RepID=UPI001D9BBE20|nr:deoxyribose-phosphate aldolase [Hoeflea sp.]MBU4531653.1 deoxyribose-phosphate aldolase [Alphaproteobacteria bacterium]MBU4544510.1 deoxyribose-phosphate aldolase [Alphaproteobacteria bacterium]MBU4552741.1 deoxyribose-phosphate aldolase [Alphaproteobacteria bacterium]MBV1724929.1 deoxyribose-phosphate aldolase [Hoeflea sp.]MBV1760949.1 deoxyribose-phosphate aldolase [Hoeflea sp.]